jgi:HD domain
MFKKIMEFFTPPLFENDEKTRIAGHVYLLSKIALALVCLLLIIYPILTRTVSRDTIVLFCLIPVAFIIMQLTRKGHVRLAGSIYTIIAWLYVNYTTLNTGGIRAVGFGGNLIILIAAAMLIDIRAVAAFGLATILAGLGLAFLQSHEILPRLPEQVSFYTSWVTQTALIIWIAGLIYIAWDNIRRALRRSLYAEKDVRKLNQELVAAYTTTLEGRAKALELRDKETEGHSRRVTELTELLAIKLGVPQKELVFIRYGSLLHDIGKMGIPDTILRKPAELNDEERKIVETHPTIAYNLLKNIGYLQGAMDIPYYHHEKWNGKGYPNALKGEKIPLSARIFAVVDVWDALQHDRFYRDAWPTDKIVAYLQEQSGEHFDPRVVEVFLANLIKEGWDQVYK